MRERNRVYADSETQVEFEKFLQSIMSGELLDELETREFSDMDDPTDGFSDEEIADVWLESR